MQRKKDTKPVNEDPVMYCSRSNGNKKSRLIHVKKIPLHLLLHRFKQIKLMLLILSSQGK